MKKFKLLTVGMFHQVLIDFYLKYFDVYGNKKQSN